MELALLTMFAIGGSVRGFETGADSYSCFDMEPWHYPASASEGVSPTRIEVDVAKYAPGEKVQVRLIGEFRGVLMQARLVDQQDDNPVGRFSNLPQGILHYLDCTAMGDSVTHMKGTLKYNISFFWIPPPQPVGRVHFLATFVQKFDIFWPRQNSSILSPIQVGAVPDMRAMPINNQDNVIPALTNPNLGKAPLPKNFFPSPNNIQPPQPGPSMNNINVQQHPRNLGNMLTFEQNPLNVNPSSPVGNEVNNAAVRTLPSNMINTAPNTVGQNIPPQQTVPTPDIGQLPQFGQMDPKRTAQQQPPPDLSTFEMPLFTDANPQSQSPQSLEPINTFRDPFAPKPINNQASPPDPSLPVNNIPQQSMAFPDQSNVNKVPQQHAAFPGQTSVNNVPQQNAAFPGQTSVNNIPQQHAVFPGQTNVNNIPQQHAAFPSQTNVNNVPQQHAAFPGQTSVNNIPQQHAASPGQSIPNSRQQNQGPPNSPLWEGNTAVIPTEPPLPGVAGPQLNPGSQALGNQAPSNIKDPIFNPNGQLVPKVQPSFVPQIQPTLPPVDPQPPFVRINQQSVPAESQPPFVPFNQPSMPADPHPPFVHFNQPSVAADPQPSFVSSNQPSVPVDPQTPFVPFNQPSVPIEPQAPFVPFNQPSVPVGPQAPFVPFNKPSVPVDPQQPFVPFNRPSESVNPQPPFAPFNQPSEQLPSFARQPGPLRPSNNEVFPPINSQNSQLPSFVRQPQPAPPQTGSIPQTSQNQPQPQQPAPVPPHRQPFFTPDQQSSPQPPPRHEHPQTFPQQQNHFGNEIPPNSVAPVPQGQPTGQQEPMPPPDPQQPQNELWPPVNQHINPWDPMPFDNQPVNNLPPDTGFQDPFSSLFNLGDGAAANNPEQPTTITTPWGPIDLWSFWDAWAMTLFN